MAYSMLNISQDGVVAPRLCTPIPSTTLQRWVFVENTVVDQDKPILVDADRPEECFLSMEDYRNLSQRFASGLIAAGFQKGQRLLMVSRNSIYCPVAFMGTVMAGGIYCTADPAYDEADISRTVAHLEPSLVLASPELEVVAAKGLAPANRVASRLVICSGNPNQPSNSDLALERAGLDSWITLFAHQVDPSSFLDGTHPDASDETIAIIHSSGTTGVPKGVQISHKNYIAASIGHMKRLETAKLRDNWSWNALGALSMHHVLGQRAYSIIFPMLSMTTYVAVVNDYKDVLRYTQELDICYAILRSSTVTKIAKNEAVVRQYKFRSLRRVDSCASGLDPSVRRVAERALSGCLPVQVAGVWGLTELGLICGWHLDDVCTNGSVGELHANYEGRVLLSNGRAALKPGAVGEIQIRTPAATCGYWQRKDATCALIQHGRWVTTGDLGYFDDAGKWFIVDRIKDLIKRHGTYISPSELEGVILEHPHVSDAAVVGIPVDEDEGPVALVVPKYDANLVPDEIVDFVNKNVPSYKRLVGGAVLVRSIPRNSADSLDPRAVWLDI
ncbi:4-coumarate-CoA ligase 1 [Beauveria brongniartii RCEF 3172]|uniref:4-coumarate-CoA ligase 1 n=1 Tax=Beauveria brongniartii RCEF 3172 TaxID=1081107 RepID=A0A162ICZ8_9HYPO|nr:4-coumarate-CoA ligase 1 [Beauveria brongniartii RCEF 3172]